VNHDYEEGLVMALEIGKGHSVSSSSPELLFPDKSASGLCEGAAKSMMLAARMNEEGGAIQHVPF
jgi:hypothetical protein